MARAASKIPEELRAIQETLADRIDKRLAVIIGTSLVVHIGIAAWAWTTDVDIPTLGTSPIAQTFHQEVMDVTLLSGFTVHSAVSSAASLSWRRRGV